MTRFSLNRERLFLVAIGGILLIIGCIYRFYPALDISLGADIAIRKKQVAAYKKRFGAGFATEAKRLDLASRLKRAETGLLSGNTAALAAVDIQNTIRKIADQLGIDVETLKVLPTQGDESSPYMSVPVQLTFESTVRQAVEALHRIETSPKILLLNGVKLSDIHRQKPGHVKVSLTLAGLMAKQ